MLGQRVGDVSNQEQQLKLSSFLKNATLEICKVLYMFYNIEVMFMQFTLSRKGKRILKNCHE